MFGRISKTYDLLNRLMSFGQDQKWRKDAVALLGESDAEIILDLGAGTGDMTMEVHRQYPRSFVVGLDLTPHMLHRARVRIQSEKVGWVIADVYNLPFTANTFSAAISGFLMRNLPNLELALSEQHRVLRESGRYICLETSPVKGGFLKPVIGFYIHKIIPILGRLISRDPAAYAYLADSTKQFVSAHAFISVLESAGFKRPRFIHRMMGAIAIHHANKR